MNKGKRIVIVGAGPAGLSAAYILAKRGCNVVLIEKEQNTGGLCSSVDYGGYIFDYGGHRLYSDDQEIIAIIKQLCGAELKIRSRKSSIYISGKFVNYPLNLKNLILNMSFTTVLSAVLEYVFRFVKNMIFPKKENNLEDWLLKRFGKVLYNIYFKPYTEKFWGLDVKEIAVDWASKRITLSGFWDVMTRILIRKKKTPLTYIDEFYYPDHGIGQIFEKMAKEIEMYGGKIVTGAELISISRDQNKISEVIFMKSGSKHCIEMEYLISSIPLSNLVSIICPELSSDIVEAASSLKFRSLIFVFIIIDEEQLTANNWIYFPEKEFIFNRIIEPKNWSSKMVPSGKTSLCVEISCSFNDEIWQETDLNIYQTVMNDLAKVFNLNKETVLKYYISKKRYCYPIYDFNYKENTTQIKHELSNIKNLISIGRNGKFYYDTTIEAVKDGFRAASRVQALIEK